MKRVADGPAAHAQPSCQIAFRRQRLTRRIRAVEDELPEAIGDFLVNSRFFDRLDQPRLARAAASLRARSRLDTRAVEWQTVPPYWFDHRSTLARQPVKNPYGTSTWLTAWSSLFPGRRAPSRAPSRSTPSSSGW